MCACACVCVCMCVCAESVCEREGRRHMRREGKSGVDNLMTPFVSLKSSLRHPFACLDVSNFVTSFFWTKFGSVNSEFFLDVFIKSSPGWFRKLVSLISGIMVVIKFTKIRVI